jgi:hypothetical protein
MTAATERNRRLAGILVWPAVVAYAWLAWSLCHDGTSPGEFAGLLIGGLVLIAFACSIDWILRGAGQLDREE